MPSHSHLIPEIPRNIGYFLSRRIRTSLSVAVIIPSADSLVDDLAALLSQRARTESVDLRMTINMV